MRREPSKSFTNDPEELAREFLDAAKEDLDTVELMKSAGFTATHNACMLISRAAEKFIKAKLLMSGKGSVWTHDQSILIDSLGEFPGKDRALDIVLFLTPFATEANYPSLTRKRIDAEMAQVAYDYLIELIEIIRPFD